MQHFRTEVPVPESAQKFSYQSRMLFMGSCFTEHIGKRLWDYKFRINLNPFGIVYNPLSIHQHIQLLLKDKQFVHTDLFYHQDLWHSFQHHGRFSGPDPMHTTKRINDALNAAREDLLRSTWLVITLGSAWVYEHIATGQVVANNHKLPDKEFKRYMLDPDKIADTLGTTILQLRKHNANLNVMLSVSPVRHLKDGAAGNQLSKASLIVAAHKIAAQAEYVHYFPAYEIMMDDLRDYRFYNADMIHPSPVAIDYVWDKFQKAYIDRRVLPIMQQVEEIRMALSHRPFNADTEGHKGFLKRNLVKAMQLKAAYPEMDFEREIAYFKG